MRKILDALYLLSGYLSAAFLVCIALTIVAQVIGRFAGIAIDSTESAGFFLAGSTFMGLAYSFRQGSHIRVTLLTRLAKGRAGRMLDLLGLCLFIAVIAVLTYSSVEMVYFSFKFDDISPGLLAIPFWIPQSTLAVGAMILLIALIDELAAVWRGNTPSYVANETPLFGNKPESEEF